MCRGSRSPQRQSRLEFNAPQGFDRPPRVLCIEPNVIPISQGHSVDRELHDDILSLPDQRLDLNTPGLAFEPGTNPVKVEVADATGFKEWTRCDRLSDFGPADTVYELDPAAASVTFGNGINGKMPAAGAQVFASYAVNDGTGGNTARNRKWLVGGISGTFGTNLDPVTGGEDPSAGPEQRRAARRALLEGHALVSSADIEAAALALPSLEVARAWVIPPQPRESETGTITLIAMQARADGVESGSIPETPRWLEAIRRQLSPRMPLGSRLVVAGPRYVEFSIQVRAEAEQGRDPVAVKSAIESELRRRLALVQRSAGDAATRVRACGDPPRPLCMAAGACRSASRVVPANPGWRQERGRSCGLQARSAAHGSRRQPHRSGPCLHRRPAMNQRLPLAYRFASEAQWNECLFAGADRDSREARNVFRPVAPYAGSPTRYQTRCGAASAISRVGEVLWRDDEGGLHRLDDCGHRVVPAPSAIAGAIRLVATSNALWVIGHAGRSLESFDPEVLTRQLVVDIPDAVAVDIAGSGDDGLFVLLERGGVWQIALYDCAGQLLSSVLLEGLSSPSALAYLQRSNRLVVLADGSSKLYWFDREVGRARFNIPVSAIRPCFTISVIGSDGCGRLVLAGIDGAPFGGRNQVLTLDADGNLLGEFVLDEAATSVAADRIRLAITTAHGLQLFDAGQTVSSEAFEVRAELITPMLRSSATDAARLWLRGSDGEIAARLHDRDFPCIDRRVLCQRRSTASFR